MSENSQAPRAHRLSHTNAVLLHALRDPFRVGQPSPMNRKAPIATQVPLDLSSRAPQVEIDTRDVQEFKRQQHEEIEFRPVSLLKDNSTDSSFIDIFYKAVLTILGGLRAGKSYLEELVILVISLSYSCRQTASTANDIPGSFLDEPLAESLTTQHPSTHLPHNSEQTVETEYISTANTPYPGVTTTQVIVSCGDTFISYSCLPTELRLEIWRLALPSPRVIEIEHCLTNHDHPWFISSESGLQPSALLRATKESREVYLNHYKLFGRQGICGPARRWEENIPVRKRLFGCQFDHRLGSGPNVYIDYSIDTLYIGPSSQNYDSISILARLTIIEPKFDLNSLRNLATDAKTFLTLGACKTKHLELLKRLPRLEHLNVTIGDSISAHRGRESWVRPVGVVKLCTSTGYQLMDYGTRLRLEEAVGFFPCKIILQTVSRDGVLQRRDLITSTEGDEN